MAMANEVTTEGDGSGEVGDQITLFSFSSMRRMAEKILTM
jgi:hypothetical protein